MPAKPKTPTFPALPVELALSLLWTHVEGGKVRVHSFTGNLLGCDVDVSDVEADARKYGIEIAGPNMMGLGHGLVIVKPIDHRKVAVFYESRQAQIERLLADNPT
jgi:hypothetical protein